MIILKKIDFHVHTIETSLDGKSNVKFDVNVLEKYIKDLRIDAIAITNHNIFDMEQYNQIVSRISSTKIFPGIEISLDTGHILVISPEEDLIEFDMECTKITNHFLNNNSISVDEFKKVFTKLDKYLLIPHYDKKPIIKYSVIKMLEKHIFCGEVQSPKKFEYCIKDDDKLTPVLFSDFRNYDYDPDPKKGKTFPVRQTYVDCEELSLSAIKLALMDKRKVSLTGSNFNENFQVLPDGTSASTGINVLIGQRSSGKTYTLDTIRNSYDNQTINYIKQFSLVEKNDEEIFKETISREQSEFTESYLFELKSLVDKAGKIDIQLNKSSISEYLTSTVSYAKNQDKEDAYSKMKLFSETTYPKEDIDDLKKVLKALQTLLENEKYKNTINKYLSNDNLLKLFVELNKKYETNLKKNFIATETNISVKTIKTELGKKSAVPQPQECDFVEYAKNKLFIDKFNSLINSVYEELIILDKSVFGTFKLIGKCSKIRNVSELKKAIGNTNISNFTADNFLECKEPHDLLLNLLKEGILRNNSDAYKGFWKIEYEIVNNYGKSLSGGEKAEYNLLSKLKDSQKYEIILIDELESSFDNIFLTSNVIQLIKDLSIKSTVFIVTHNNNLGVLIKPNRIIYTEKNITSSGLEYKIFSGNYDAKELKTMSGEAKSNYFALINTMEAGEEAYDERRMIYENIKNR
jgi:hypothetical protein